MLRKIHVFLFNLCFGFFLGTKRLVKDRDQSFVTMRPKKYVGSSGSVWASNLLRLHQQYPDHFSPPGEPSMNSSTQLRSFCRQLRDIAFYFVDATTEVDLTMLEVSKPKDSFREYELSRIDWLMKMLQKLEPADGKDDEEKSLLLKFKEIIDDEIQGASRNLKELLLSSDDIKSTLFFSYHEKVTQDLMTIIELIDEKKLASAYVYISEYTDAGPGVGVSNIEAKLRFVEMCRLQRSDRRIRIHRAPGDSAQNEAERTNACIGDAMVDGGTLQWEKFRALDELSDEEVQRMGIEEIEQRESECMEKNAWHVAKELSLRVDDEPGPGGDYMISEVAERLGKLFLSNALSSYPYL